MRAVPATFDRAVTGLRMPGSHPTSRVYAPLLDAAGGSTAGASPSGVALDPQALQRLRDLDPTGTGKLMERVANAFETAAARLLPQLRAAQAAADAEGIRHVAHTLKSSSASIGAVKLSRLCAEMELLAKQGQIDGTHEAVDALASELAAVLAVLKLVLLSPP